MDTGVVGDDTGSTVVGDVGLSVVDTSVLRTTVGSNVVVMAGATEGVAGVGAGAVLTSDEEPKVVAAVGLIVDDEGERVEPWGGRPGVGPVVVVVVVGNDVGSA